MKFENGIGQEGVQNLVRLTGTSTSSCSRICIECTVVLVECQVQDNGILMSENLKQRKLQGNGKEMRDAIVIHHYIIRAGHRDEPNFHLSNTVDGVPTSSGSSPTLYSNTSSTMHF